MPRFGILSATLSLTLDTHTPLNAALDVSLKLDGAGASKDSPAGIANGWLLGNSDPSEYNLSRIVFCEERPADSAVR